MRSDRAPSATRPGCKADNVGEEQRRIYEVLHPTPDRPLVTIRRNQVLDVIAAPMSLKRPSDWRGSRANAHTALSERVAVAKGPCDLDVLGTYMAREPSDLKEA